MFYSYINKTAVDLYIQLLMNIWLFQFFIIMKEHEDGVFKLLTYHIFSFSLGNF